MKCSTIIPLASRTCRLRVEVWGEHRPAAAPPLSAIRVQDRYPSHHGNDERRNSRSRGARGSHWTKGAAERRFAKLIEQAEWQKGRIRQALLKNGGEREAA